MPTEPMTDDALVARCQKELPYNTSGFEVLVARHEPAVFQLCARYLGSDEDAEEASQNTFMKVFRSIGKFEHRSQFKTWLYRIAVNECATMYRRRARRARHEQPSIVGVVPEVHVHQPEISETDGVVEGPVGEALEVLSDTDRQILVLRHVGGLPLQDVARELGIGLSAAKMRLYRAEERFRSAFSGSSQEM